MNHKTTVPITEVSERLGMSRSAVYAAINSGKIPSIKLNRSIRIPRDAFEDFMSCGRKSKSTVDIEEIIRTARIEMLRTQKQQIEAQLNELEGKSAI